MSGFERLLDSWHGARQHRVPMPHGRRVMSVENAIGGSMRPGRLVGWLQLDREEQSERDRDKDEERQEDERAEQERERDEERSR